MIFFSLVIFYCLISFNTVHVLKVAMGQLFFVILFTFLITGLFAQPEAQQFDTLIFVQIPSEAGPNISADVNELSFKGRYVKGARIITWNGSTSKITNLTPDFEAACDPDIAPDGKSMIFCGIKTSSDTWQIWKMNPNGSDKVQITQNSQDCFAPTYAGNRFYLNDPQPTPQIIYVSRESDKKNSPYAIYATDIQGEITRRLSFNLLNDYAPDVLPDGRILFSSWQRSGKGQDVTERIALMAINNDGTDLMAYYGNHENPLLKEMINISQFDDRVYFIESEQYHWLGGGSISSVSQNRPLHSYRKINHDNKGKELYHSPAALPNGELIASYRTNTSDSEFAIYLLDQKTGKRIKELYQQPGWHTIDTQVLLSYRRPKGRSNWLIPGSTSGVFYCLDIYISNLYMEEPIPRGSVKYVRVIEGKPKINKKDITNQGSKESEYRNVLGVSPVENDGSFHIRVPAEMPLTFQLLDENQFNIRSQKAWTWVMGNENRGCIGCHEDREWSPPNKMVDAILKPAVDLTSSDNQCRKADFLSQILPIIDNKCAVEGCHISGTVLPNLDNGIKAGSKEHSARIYDLLVHSHNKKHVIPGRAIDSPLINHFLSSKTIEKPEHLASQTTKTKVKIKILDEKELRTFIEWIDLGAQWDAAPD